MAAAGITVRRATIADLDRLVQLFDAYRQFYRRPSDPEGARRFLAERMEREESVILLAVENTGTALGFAQVYPSFSSGAIARIFILNDLYVSGDSRRRGAASALLEAAGRFGRSVGALRLTLSTEVTNSTARAVYGELGWKQDDVFCVYHLGL